MTSKFDVKIAMITFHTGVIFAIVASAISIFFLKKPYNIFAILISILIGIFLMFKGYEIGKSLKK